MKSSDSRTGKSWWKLWFVSKPNQFESLFMSIDLLQEEDESTTAAAGTWFPTHRMICHSLLFLFSLPILLFFKILPSLPHHFVHEVHAIFFWNIFSIFCSFIFFPNFFLLSSSGRERERERRVSSFSQRFVHLSTFFPSVTFPLMIFRKRDRERERWKGSPIEGKMRKRYWNVNIVVLYICSRKGRYWEGDFFFSLSFSLSLPLSHNNFGSFFPLLFLSFSCALNGSNTSSAPCFPFTWIRFFPSCVYSSHLSGSKNFLSLPLFSVSFSPSFPERKIIDLRHNVESSGIVSCSSPSSSSQYSSSLLSAHSLSKSSLAFTICFSLSHLLSRSVSLSLAFTICFSLSLAFKICFSLTRSQDLFLSLRILSLTCIKPTAVLHIVYWLVVPSLFDHQSESSLFSLQTQFLLSFFLPREENEEEGRNEAE